MDELICQATGARGARRSQRLQSLWSGWGEVVRYDLEGPLGSVVVKRVQPPPGPHGRGDQRKHRSYEVEQAFYEDFATRCRVRVPRAYHIEPGCFVLEDLDAAGFAGRAVGAGSLSDEQVGACVEWLAGFHASFLGTEPKRLWPVGTYWHLETRPDEWQRMEAGPLRDAAAAIDTWLTSTHFPTLVHGDAKVANFCFASNAVAAVDFQYVGGGCGLKDVAYFLGSVLDDEALTRTSDRWLDRYFEALRGAAGELHPELEADWRSRWPLAWADFERFLAGWAPHHWKRTGFAARQTLRALEQPLHNKPKL